MKSKMRRFVVLSSNDKHIVGEAYAYDPSDAVRLVHYQVTKTSVNFEWVSFAFREDAYYCVYDCTYTTDLDTANRKNPEVIKIARMGQFMGGYAPV